MKKYTPLIIVLAILLPMIFAPSCANTTQAPSGGKKDTIPPYITMITPLPGALNMPCQGAEIVFEFNEYVTIKNQQNIFLSPPLSKAPKAKIKNKSLVVSFEEDLQPQTTYFLDLTGAIGDNNEGNMFPGYTYCFSTGDFLDSLYITGHVQDGSTLDPIKNATVMLYKDHSDSAIFKSRPFAAVKTDDWGFFALPYLRDTLYRLYAVQDASNNNIYDPDADRIAFLDSLIRPVNVVDDEVPELKKYDMTDTINCEKRIADYELYMFREKPSKQFIDNYGRTGEKSAFISFNAEYAWIDSLWFRNYPSEAVICQFNNLQDSLELWLNDKGIGPDTLKLAVNYRKTDSLGNMTPFLEEIKLFEEGLGRRGYIKKRNNPQKTHADTICAVTLTAVAENLEENGFELVFALPVVNAKFDSIRFTSINPKQVEQDVEYEIIPDSTNIRKFNIKLKGEYQTGFEYRIKIPQNCFRDINGFYSDSLDVKTGLPTDESLSTLSLDIENVKGKYIVDLMDDGCKNILRSYVIREDSTVVFKYLKTGRYAVRISEDLNENSIVDTGDILKHRQCETVRFYNFGTDKYIQIPEGVEFSNTIDLEDLF